MKTAQSELIVENIVDGEQDKLIIDAMRKALRFYKDKDFQVFLEDMTEPLYDNHSVMRGVKHLSIRNRQDVSKLVAIIIEKSTEKIEDVSRRWTRDEIRRLRRCWPYPAKWAHLCNTSRRPWAEIEEKAKELWL